RHPASSSLAYSGTPSRAMTPGCSPLWWRRLKCILPNGRWRLSRPSSPAPDGAGPMRVSTDEPGCIAMAMHPGSLHYAYLVNASNGDKTGVTYLKAVVSAGRASALDAQTMIPKSFRTHNGELFT